MGEQTDLRKLLVLHGPALDAEGILDFLREHFQVAVADELDEALTAMRQERFDAVLAETADFLPLERGVVTQQASVILDTIGDGVCIVGSNGQLVWANRRLRDFPEKVLRRVREVCVEAYEDFATSREARGGRGRRFSIRPGDGRYYEVICSPVRDRGGILRQVAGVVVDATLQRRQQLKLNAIDRAGRELVRFDYDTLSRLDARERIKLLEDRIIRYSHDVLDYEHFAVLLLDEKTNRLEVLVSEGLDEASERYELFAGTEGNGITGYVAATGRSYICPDVQSDPRYVMGLGDARSSLTVPLRLHDVVVGVLNVESSTPAVFGEEDRQFAEIFANYIAMSLHVLNLLVSERHTTHTQVSGSISADVAGPLTDIITEATELKDDYIGHDDIRRRLTDIIDRASAARKTIHDYTQAFTTGVVSGPAPAEQREPALDGLHVLVADDEELIRQTLRDVLVPFGCEVDTAIDGADAIEKLHQAHYDLVISDIRMPGANGYEVFAAARQADPRTAVVLTTAFGYDPNHSILRANEEDSANVLTKPFKVWELAEKCRDALEQVGRLER
jgi:CheY-like chemotaxis protein/PAS domain-containing protein